METLILCIFILGYLAITFEHVIRINKTASALLAGICCWTVYVFYSENTFEVNSRLAEHLGDIAAILIFLLGAMTIVELVDAHQGFDVITSRIQTRNKSRLLVLIALVSFFLSSVLDNLTTTIVMITLIRKLVREESERFYFAAIVVIAANAGGAWTPIGDVTTTMLWIGGQITTGAILKTVFLPSIICLLIPLIWFSKKFKGDLNDDFDDSSQAVTASGERNLIFFTGIGALVFVPVFKTLTGLPPYMGMLFGLSILWILTEILHHKKNEEERNKLSISFALKRIDTASVLFFLGILLCVACLESAGLLTKFTQSLEKSVGNLNVIVITLGLISSFIDNVPLVAGTMGMYDLHTYPPDHFLWRFIAYCCGTGGSILIIGSAAGVAAMGMERINFLKYMRKVSFITLIGYLAGAFVFILFE